MKKLLFACSLLLLLTACQDRFSVEGCVENAEKQTLYFEWQSLEGTQLLDSVVLKADGKFSFKQAMPESPEFYRLRLGKQSIPLAVDSVCQIVIKTDSAQFNTNYLVEGSLQTQYLRELFLLQKQTLTKFDSIDALWVSGKLKREDCLAQMLACVEEYKTEATNYIYNDPKSPAAYYALYQRLHRYLIFNPSDKDDSKLFAAVATSWELFYPQAKRTQNLKQLTLSGLADIRKQREAEAAPQQDIIINEIEYLSYFPIALPNIFGEKQALSDLEGKVILLDFTAYQTDYSAARTLQMRELYQQFEGRGFEIYQVSLDTDEHFWKTSALNLPWVCVRDSRSLASPYLRMYNVQQIPTFFLIDKEGHLVARDETIKDLAKEIVDLLRK